MRPLLLRLLSRSTTNDGDERRRSLFNARALGGALQVMLKLRTIGIRDYSVLEGRQRIGRIRFASVRSPGIWIWNV